MNTPRESPLLTWLVEHLVNEHSIAPTTLEGRSLQNIDGFHDGRHISCDMHDHSAYELAKLAHREWIMEMVNEHTTDVIDRVINPKEAG